MRPRTAVIGIVSGTALALSALGVNSLASRPRAAHLVAPAPAAATSITVVATHKLSGVAGRPVQDAHPVEVSATPDVALINLLVMVDWGDGTAPVQAMVNTYTPDVATVLPQSHSYTDVGDYTATITITDRPTKTTVTTRVAATVIDPADAPRLSGFGINLHGATSNCTMIVAEVYDVDDDVSSAKAVVSFGDGSSDTAGVLLSMAGGANIIAGCHHWPTVGDYTMTTTYTSPSGATLVMTSTYTAKA